MSVMSRAGLSFAGRSMAVWTSACCLGHHMLLLIRKLSAHCKVPGGFCLPEGTGTRWPGTRRTTEITTQSSPLLDQHKQSFRWVMGLRQPQEPPIDSSQRAAHFSVINPSLSSRRVGRGAWTIPPHASSSEPGGWWKRWLQVMAPGSAYRCGRKVQVLGASSGRDWRCTRAG